MLKQSSANRGDMLPPLKYRWYSWKLLDIGLQQTEQRQRKMRVKMFLTAMRLSVYFLVMQVKINRLKPSEFFKTTLGFFKKKKIFFAYTKNIQLYCTMLLVWLNSVI